MTGTKRQPPDRAPACVLIVDDHPIVRHGLALMVNQYPDLQVNGEAGTIADALDALAQQGADIVVVDIALGGADGLELMKQIKARWPDVRMLALSMYSEKLYAERSLRAGASGFLMKERAPDEFIVAIREVLNGGLYVSDDLKARWLKRMVGGKGEDDRLPVASLSDRELEVMRLMGSGLSTRRIAESLNLSVKTIQSHQDHLKRKLGLGSVAELTHYATLWLQQESRP